jgi:hypothetical protein
MSVSADEFLHGAPLPWPTSGSRVQEFHRGLYGQLFLGCPITMGEPDLPRQSVLSLQQQKHNGVMSHGVPALAPRWVVPKFHGGTW